MINEEKVLASLGTVQEPELHNDLVSLNFIRNINIQGNDVSFTIMLTTPACPLKHVLEGESKAALRRDLPDIGKITIQFDSQVRRDARIAEKLNLNISNIIAVGSGKGGVGKSTMSVNLAIALAQEGARVGLLDADIYGPNIPHLLGVSDGPEQNGDKLVPAELYGLHIMSMGFLIPDEQALVWRGPMIHSAISQLFTDVLWPELDYLIVDLPPGTGDAQLSLAQLVPITGGILVTTPQIVSLADARRGADAFDRLDVPVLGIIENMSGEVFGKGGGERMASELETDFLGSIPMDARFAASADQGIPFMVQHTENELAEEFKKTARTLAGKISTQLHVMAAK